MLLSSNTNKQTEKWEFNLSNSSRGSGLKQFFEHVEPVGIPLWNKPRNEQDPDYHSTKASNEKTKIKFNQKTMHPSSKISQRKN